MSKKVMLVDDAGFIRMVLRKLLVNEGYEVVGEAADGDIAIETYVELCKKGQRPDVVIMDITMKEMDGVTALKELKKIDETVKVVMCTALNQSNIVKEAIDAGASHYIVKPFENQKVLETLQFVLD